MRRYKMAMPGETIHLGAPSTCEDCGVHVQLEVLRSAAGSYIGTQCNCGPYSRESGYYANSSDARDALETDAWIRR